MFFALSATGKAAVALLAEGVDRNYYPVFANLGEQASPSSRRAWIEIRSDSRQPQRFSVALLAEGVDRNTWPPKRKRFGSCRPPRGGRG